MKVIYVGGEPCEFCLTVQRYYPQIWKPTDLVKGRCYTVVKQRRYRIPLDPRITTTAYWLAEAPQEGNWKHCCCEFRPIDGDDDTWRETMRKHKSSPKTQELEPA